MRMDHHCPWTGNCVGLKTHKYFICFTFWTVIACLHVGLVSPIMNKHANPKTSLNDPKWASKYDPLNPLLASILAFSVSIGVSVLWCLHMWFLKENHTSIESGALLIGGNPFKIFPNSNNVKQILGPTKWKWFLPMMPERNYFDHDGKEIPNPHYLDGL